jgi:sugar (pentulose or hexulose) kinase
MFGRKFTSIHMQGGANRNKLLVRLTKERTGVPFEIWENESTTIGSLAVQLAASEAGGQAIKREAVQQWSNALCQLRPLNA